MDDIPGTTLSGLPVELLDLIVSFLNVLDVARLQQVSAGIRTVCVKPFAKKLERKGPHHLTVRDEGDSRDLAYVQVGDQGLYLRHRDSYDGCLFSCAQPAMVSLLFSIAHNAFIGERFTTLALDGADYITHAGIRCPGLRHLYFPNLTRLEFVCVRVREVEDVATAIRAHASTLKDLVLTNITVLSGIRRFVLDWFALMDYISDELQLENLEMAIWQKELFALTKMIDYRHVCYDEKGKIVRFRRGDPVPAAQEYFIEEVRLRARGRDAVRDGLTAHLGRMRRRERAQRVERSVTRVFTPWRKIRG